MKDYNPSPNNGAEWGESKPMANNEWNEIDGITREFPIYYCAFLDILGYKEKSELYFRNRFNIPERIERAFATAMTAARVTSCLVDTSGLTIETFSDSIVILQPADNRGIGVLLLIASIFVSNLSFESLFVRGGISIGKHSEYITSTGFRVLTSEALQRAYKLESEVADTPRVVIDQKIIGNLGTQEKGMIISEGETFILHFANHAIERQGTNLDDVYSEMIDIKQVRDNATDDRIRAKYQWLLDYYYWTIALIDGIDASRFLPFTSVAESRFTMLK